MANTRSYPKVNAKSSDLVLGTSMPLPNSNDDPRTVNFSIGQINGLANSPDIVTAQATITDAQIRTLGTVPVEILPAVTGYIYEILGATTQSINSGGIGDSYDWGGQSGVISSRSANFTNLHKVEIPNAQLPSGGAVVSNSLYVGTPLAGLSRTGGSIKITVTDNIDPTIPIAQTPSAQLLINITYKLTQVQ